MTRLHSPGAWDDTATHGNERDPIDWMFRP